MSVAQTVQRQLSSRAFRIGLGVVVLIYVLLFAYLAAFGKVNTVVKLASVTIEIEREAEAPPAPVTPPTTPPPVIPPSATGDVAASTSATDGVALVAAPIDGLSEDTADGRLPKIRDADKMTSFQAYRRPYVPVVPAKPTIAIGVVDYGLSEIESKATLSDLSPEVSVVMTPYTKSADFWVNQARSSGHEVWLELPVETELYPRNDSGPQTLLVGAIEKQNLKKLAWVLSQAQGYAGVVTPYQPSFMKSDTDVKPVVSEIFSRGLGFIDGGNLPSPLASSMANGTNAPYNNVDVWIDIPATSEHMAASLRQLEVLAQGRGSAIGLISATPTTRKTLQTWIDGLKQKGIVLVPLSAETGKAK